MVDLDCASLISLGIKNARCYEVHNPVLDDVRAVKAIGSFHEGRVLRKGGQRRVRTGYSGR